METRVINIRKAPPNWQYDEEFVYIGRAGKGMKGPFGNPVRRGSVCPECAQVHMTNASTIPCYTKLLAKRLKTDTKFREAVCKLRGKSLVCFCKPAPCHGDVLKAFAEDMRDA